MPRPAPPPGPGVRALLPEVASIESGALRSRERGREGHKTAAGTPPPSRNPGRRAAGCAGLRQELRALGGERQPGGAPRRVSGSSGDSGPRPHTSLGSADLAQLGGSLGLVAREEGVGVLQAAAEGEVGALGIGGEAAHLVLTVGQDLGHGGRGVGAGLRRGAGGGLAAGPALAQQGSRRKDEVMQHPGLRSQAGPPPPRLRLPGRWAGGGGGGGGGDGDRAGAVRGGRGWRRRQERNDDERPTAAERGRRGAVEVGRAPAQGERRGGGGCGQELAQHSTEGWER